MNALLSSICCILIHGMDELDKPKEYRDTWIMFFFWGLVILIFVFALMSELN